MSTELVEQEELVRKEELSVLVVSTIVSTDTIEQVLKESIQKEALTNDMFIFDIGKSA